MRKGERRPGPRKPRKRVPCVRPAVLAWRAMAAPPLPLPIAALVRRARNATDPTRKHLASYYAWEASIRLTVAAEPPADVSTLGMPSTGHWVKAMPPRPGSLTDPALLALHALLAEV